MVSAPLTIQDFSSLITDFCPDIAKGYALAVGCSGGPDSMALTCLLSRWSDQNDGPDIHAVIVNHGLRPEATEEALRVSQWLEEWPRVKPVVLCWEGDKPETAIQEEARRARYNLFVRYCNEQGISCLALAHHRDDQAETVLFRLTKGSGLDGLTGIPPVQTLDGGVRLVRPLLGFSKGAILETCAAMDIPYVQDPSNQSEKYARVRLRKSMPVLEEEGLTSKRLATTAMRLQRARQALDELTNRLYREAVRVVADDRTDGPDSITIDMEMAGQEPDEIGLRVLLKAIAVLRPEADYAPRLERVEALFKDAAKAATFRKRTLGGLVFVRKTFPGQLEIYRE